MFRFPSTVPLLSALILAVGVATWFAHAPTLDARAVTFDDDEYLLENSLVQNPSWESARRFMTEVWAPSTVKGYYQPMTMISLMIDCALGGRPDRLRPFHVTSLALHVGTTVLIVVLLVQLFGHPWAAALAGLLFGVHPLTIESIPWIAERKTILAAFFALGALVAYVRNARRPGRVSYGVSLILFAFSLLSKPTATPLPVLLLILDYWPLRRLGQRALLEKIPFFAVAAISAVITLQSQTQTYGTTLLYEKSTLGALLVMCHNVVFYLRKLAWPGELSWYYPYPDPFTLTHPAVWAGLLGTLMVVAIVLISLRWTRSLAAAGTFFFVGLLPTMSGVAFFGLIAADRFAYFPAVGLLLPLSALIAGLWPVAKVEKSKSRKVEIGNAGAGPWMFPSAAFTLRGATIVAGILVWASFLTVSTRRHLGYWKDSETLARRMAQFAPTASVPRVSVGNALLAQNRLDEAMSEFQEALKLDPNNYTTHTALATALTKVGRTDQAVVHYREALRLKPDFPRALNNLGGALVQDGQFADAVECLRRALAQRPEYPQAHLNLARALAALGKSEEAIRHAREALRLTPLDAQNHVFVAGLFLEMGQIAGALEILRKALPLASEEAEYRVRICELLARHGRTNEAIEHCTRAVALRPDDAGFRVNLANALLTAGRIEEAVGRYGEALRLDPNHRTARVNLAHALGAQGAQDEAAEHLTAALRAEPADADVQYQLGLTLHQLGRADQAAEHYREALRLRPEFAEAHNNLAALLADRGSLDEALDHCRRAVQLQPDAALVRINLADVLTRKGRIEEAIQECREAVRLEPNVADWHARLGLLLEKGGHLAEARAQFQEAIRLDPNQEEARTHLQSTAADQSQSGP